MSLDEEFNELSSISCEPCRAKKRKCDRRFPICSLCRNSGTLCNYPERGKRGMPVGYIVSLEKRMIEVEAALFQVYAEFQQYREGVNITTGPIRGTIKALEDYYGNLSKQEKSAEWEQQSMIESCSRLDWWNSRNETLRLGVKLPAEGMSKQPADQQQQQQRLMDAQLGFDMAADSATPDPFSEAMIGGMPSSSTWADAPVSDVYANLDIRSKYKYF